MTLLWPGVILSLAVAIWRVAILDRFPFSARVHAPPGSPQAQTVRQTIEGLAGGPLPEDAVYIVAPCVPARARGVPGTTLVVVYDIARASTIRIYAVVPDVHSSLACP